MNKRKILELMTSGLSLICTAIYYSKGDLLLGTVWCINTCIWVAKFITD